MNNFELAGMSISVKASPYRIQSAVGAMFQMLNRTDKAADIHLEGQGFYYDEIYKSLPKWLQSKIYNNDLDVESVLFVGPEKQIAAAAIKDGLLFCAWTSKMKNEIRFACSMKKTGTSTGLFQPVLVPVLREVFLNRNCFLIHSASVFCSNGLGFLIIAPSGGGKTTTALSLVRIGAKLLGDDLIVIKISNNNITAFGIPEPMNLTNETMNFFHETKRFSDTIAHIPGYAKKSVLPKQVFGPDCLIPHCPVHIVYFINVSKDGPNVRPLPVGEALKKLLLSHAFSRNQEINASSVSQFCTILEQVSAYELNTGPDPENLGKWLIHNSSNHLTQSIY